VGSSEGPREGLEGNGGELPLGLGGAALSAPQSSTEKCRPRSMITDLCLSISRRDSCTVCGPDLMGADEGQLESPIGARYTQVLVCIKSTLATLATALYKGAASPSVSLECLRSGRLEGWEAGRLEAGGAQGAWYPALQRRLCLSHRDRRSSCFTRSRLHWSHPDRLLRSRRLIVHQTHMQQYFRSRPGRRRVTAFFFL